jgi:hypothetical protein
MGTVWMIEVNIYLKVNELPLSFAPWGVWMEE